MSNPWKSAIFDGAIRGPLASRVQHTRNVQTRDHDGHTVAANQPLYARQTLIGTRLELSETITGGLVGGGVDRDGSTPLLVHLNGNNVVIRRGTIDNVVYDVEHVNGDDEADLMLGSVSGFRFPSAGGGISVTHGFIAFLCQRISTADDQIKGIAVVWTNDLGQTWSVLEDGSGNQTFPEFKAGSTRATLAFAINPVGFPEQDGSALAFRIGFADYQAAPGPGWQAGIFRISRASVDDPLVPSNARLLDSEDTDGTHLHAVWPIMGDGWAGAGLARGDGASNNQVALVYWDESDPGDYLTATLNYHRTWGGKTSADTSGGRGSNAPQPVGFMPGPDFNTAMTPRDVYWGALLCYPPEGDDTSDFANQTMRAQPLYMAGSSEDFGLAIRDAIGRRDFAFCGGNTSSMGNEYEHVWMSRDGRHWGIARHRSNTHFQQSCAWFGDQLCIRNNASGIDVYDVQWGILRRPLVVGPGVYNRINASSWSALTNPANTGNGTITVTQLTPTNGVYHYPAGHPKAGEELPEQPPGFGPVYAIRNVGLERSGGVWDLYGATVSGVTAGTLGTLDLAVMPLESGVAAHVFVGDRTLSTTDESVNAPSRLRIAQNQRWTRCTTRGDFHTNRISIGIDCTQTAANNVRAEDWWLLQVVNASVGTEQGTWPHPADTDASAIPAIVQVSYTLATEWSVRLLARVPEIVRGSEAWPKTLLTLKLDDTHYVRLEQTDSITLTLAIADGGEETTSTNNTLIAEPGSQVGLVVYGDGEELTVKGSIGPQPTTVTLTGDDILAGETVSIVVGNVDADAPPSLEVAELSVMDTTPSDTSDEGLFAPVAAAPATSRIGVGMIGLHRPGRLVRGGQGFEVPDAS